MSNLNDIEYTNKCPFVAASTMKPISLHGHERSITQIRYNREGDLLFSSAKDMYPNVWYAINGERLGEKLIQLNTWLGTGHAYDYAINAESPDAT